MPETDSTLSLTIDNLRTEAALVFGYNPTYASCTATQKLDIDRAVDSGDRQFRWPPQAPDPDNPRVPVSHIWSFMCEMSGTLSLTAGDWDYDLPYLFGHIKGDRMFIPTSGEAYDPIILVDAKEILRLRQADHTTRACPTYVAIRPKASFTGALAQHYEAIFWMTPNTTYTVSYIYAPLGNAMITSSNPYPWGGAAHAETIKASVRAEAEFIRYRQRNVEWQKFIERLTASIRIDRQMFPRVLGKNVDTSDDGETTALEDVVDHRRFHTASVTWV